jgi:hypothetical protein
MGTEVLEKTDTWVLEIAVKNRPNGNIHVQITGCAH